MIDVASNWEPEENNSFLVKPYNYRTSLTAEVPQIFYARTL